MLIPATLTIRVNDGRRHSKRQARPAGNAKHSREVNRRIVGVADGIRTHDNWNHNPGLYR
jgi:hypothetical protein